MSVIPKNNDEFAELVFSQEERRSAAPSLDIASRRDPDRHAENLKLAKEQRLPIDTVDRQIDEVRRRKLLSEINIADLNTSHPKTSKWLENSDNASIAIDDINVLKGLEEITKEPERGFWNNTMRGGLTRVNTLTGNLLEFAGNTSASIEEYMDSIGIPNPGIIIGEDGISWSSDIPTEIKPYLTQIGRAVSEGDGYGYKPSFTWEKLKGDITPKNLSGYITEQGVQSLPDMAAALFTLPAYIMSRTEEIAEERVANDDRDQVSGADLATSLVPATAVSLIERLGAKFTFDVAEKVGVKEIVKAAGKAGTVEGATEFVQEGIEYLGETAFTEKDVLFAEMLDRQFAGLVAGAGMGSTIRGSTATVQAIGNRTNRQIRNNVRSEIDQQTIDKRVPLTQSSKTRGRSTERFEEFINTLGADREVLIPEEIATQLEGAPDYITEQIDGTGISVAIPLNKFDSEIAPNEEWMNIIRPHIKLSEGTQSQAEIESEEADPVLKKLLEQAQASQETLTEADRIFEVVQEQLVATGMQSEQTARDSAAIYPARAAVMVENAKKLGQELSINEAFEMMGFQIRGVAEALEADGRPGEILEQSRIEGYEGENITEADEWVRAKQKGLDMSQEDRIERAKNMGFNTDQVLYHGTQLEFGEFDPKRIGKRYGVSDEGFFFSNNEQTASAYGETIPVYLSIQNPMIIDLDQLPEELGTPSGRTQAYFDENAFELVQSAQENNNDAIFIEQGGESMVVVFEPNQIRSIDAAFDPDYRETGRLMAQIRGIPTMSQTQDFTGIELTEERIIEETGEKVTITQDAQQTWEQTQQRRNIIERLGDCLRAG